MKPRLNLFVTQMSRENGGMENTAYYLAKGLKKDFEVRAYCILGKNDIINGVKTFSFSNHKVLNLIQNIVKYPFENMGRNAVQSVSLCMSWKHAFVPFLYHKIFRIPYVIMTFGAEVLPIKENTLFARISSDLRRNIFVHAAYICADSRYTENLDKKIYSKIRSTVIHPCSGEKIVPYVEGNPNVILSIGRLDERKGFQDVIYAVKEVRKEIPDIHYHLAGEGSYKNELQKLVRKLKIEDNCTFWGKVSEEQKRKLLDGCSLLAMPSFYIEEDSNVEGFGIVFLEANAHGKPVIATKSGGIPDAVIPGKTGVLIEERNINELKQAIIDLLTGKIQVDSDTCQNWAQQHYYPVIISKYKELLIRLLNRTAF